MAIPGPLLGPICVQNLKAIRALENAHNRYPHLPWALWENRKYHNCGPGRARTMIIFTPSKPFYRSTFWEKNWLAAHSRSWEPCIRRFSHPTHWCPQSLRKRDLHEKPRNLLQSDEQCPGAPLSHLRKFLQLQVAQIRAWKLCGKPFQGLLLGTRGTENFTQCLTMKLWSGANFWHQFWARPWKWPAQVLGRVGYCGLMGPNGKIF